MFYLNGQPTGGGRYVFRFVPFFPADAGLTVLPVPIFGAPITVEGVAAKMISLMRAEQPKGPYMLGGNCFGAKLAYEMAQQLVRAGERVSLLVLVHPERRMAMHRGFRTIRRLAIFAGLDEAAHLGQFSGALDYTARTFGKILRALRQDSSRERINRMSEAGRWMLSFIARRAGKTLDTWPDSGNCAAHGTDETCNNDNSAAQEIQAHANYVGVASMGYEFKQYDGWTAVIWPLEGPANPPWDPRVAWDKVVPRSDWYFVNGNHMTMMSNHFEETARAIGVSVQRGMDQWKA